MSTWPNSAWAAPPIFKILPQNAILHCAAKHPCTQPTVDGYVAPLEYADGRQFPLQDYAHGGPNGELYLMVSDVPTYNSAVCNVPPPGSPSISWAQTNPCRARTLFIGLKVPRAKDAQGHFLDASGQVLVWLDANRADTLNGVAGTALPRSEDRKLILVYNTAPNGTTTLSQYVGNGQGWVLLPSNVLVGWPVIHEILVPGADSGHVHIELAVALHPALSTASEPLSSHKLGLGLQVLPNRALGGPMVGGGSLPNDKNSPPLDTSTLSWVTLDLSNPDPIPMSFALWNVGQMPYIAANGGSGNAASIAQQIFQKDTVCLSEVWTSAERQDIVHKVNALRVAQLLPPMNAIDEGNDVVLDPAVHYTGLLLLTAHAILLGGIHHFPPDLCTGWDCAQHKGVMWARLALPTAHNVPGKPNLVGPPTPAQGLDGSEFMDVFCSHVNAGDYEASVDTDIRHMQFENIRAYIDHVHQGGPLTDWPVYVEDDRCPEGMWSRGDDRPAVLLGDMNTPGPRGPSQIMGPYMDTQQYTEMMYWLKLDHPTGFDKTNSLFSDSRDLGQSVFGPDPSASGTWLSSLCTPNVNNELNSKNRIDYVLILPSADTDQLPTFALMKEPTASVNPHFDPNSPLDPLVGCITGNCQCLSDHAELDVNLALTRVKDKLKYNAMKPHRVEFTVRHLKDLAGGGCCADWYTPSILLTAPGLGTQTDLFLDHALYEGDESSPNWNVSTGTAALPNLPAGFQGTISTTFALWDYDSGSGDDHYDSIPQGGNGTAAADLDVHITFFATTGALNEVAGAGANWTVPVAFIGNVNGGITDFIFTTTGNNQDTGDNAVVTVGFSVTELDGP